MTHNEMSKMSMQQLTELGHIERSKAFRKAFSMIAGIGSGRRSRKTRQGAGYEPTSSGWH